MPIPKQLTPKLKYVKVWEVGAVEEKVRTDNTWQCPIDVVLKVQLHKNTGTTVTKFRYARNMRTHISQNMLQRSV